MNDNSFEKFPGEKLNTSSEDEIRATEWQNAMNGDDVPAFAGDISMTAESATSEAGTEALEADDQLASEDQNNKGLIDAAAIINYGLNAAAREYGVETVVQKIKSFDASGSENPIRDLFLYLGVDTPAEFKDVQLEREAVKFKEADFYSNSEVAPMTKKRSPEGAFKAIKDMKELITEVEGADPRFAGLRAEARATGKGYFEYAVGSKVNRDLTDLFGALAAEPKVEEPGAEMTETEALGAQSTDTENPEETPGATAS